MSSFQVQQYRWAKGLVQTGLKLLPGILRSKHSLQIKVEACFHLTANLAYPLMLALAALILPSMLMRYAHLDGRLLWLDLPAFVMTFCSLSSFYALAQQESGRGAAQRHLHRIPMLVAVGIGLALSNTRAVLEALFGRRSAFERTVKLGADSRSAAEALRKYGRRGSWRTYANLAAASYFAICLGIAVYIGHWLGLPVIGLFLLGFSYAALSTSSRGRSGERPTLRTAGEPAS